MVSNSVVTRIGLRWLVNALITAAIFASLYKHWLTTPVLRYVSVGQWRWLAKALLNVGRNLGARLPLRYESRES